MTAATAQIAKSIEKGIQRGKLAEQDPAIILGRIRWEADLAAAAGAEFIIEAVSENEPLKIDVLRALDRSCPALTGRPGTTFTIWGAGGAASAGNGWGERDR